jgi:Mn2+/Fe2+ NRAMP family transporter
MRRRSGMLAVLAVAGPGILAGLSDDDPAGITTYSILGAEHGYALLWVLLLSTAALALFHEVALRMGVVTGQGLTGLVRERYGVRIALVGLIALLVANVGTTSAEFAGVAASLELAGVSKYLSVPVAAILVATLVIRGTFRRVEHVLLALGTLFASYIAAGILAGPDWGSAVSGLIVPTPPRDSDALLVTAAVVGTTLAPWGLAFIQSYAVDKKLRPVDLRWERVDVFVGALMTGVIGFFVVVASAATLHEQGRSIDDAADAATALEPLAGGLASTLFGAGLLGAALLAASILPLSTAYSVSEALGREGALDDSVREAPLFYGTYVVVMALGAGLVLLPGAPLVGILFGTQALNAVLLVPLLALVHGISRDSEVMGEHASGRVGLALQLTVLLLVTACTLSLAAAWLV